MWVSIGSETAQWRGAGAHSLTGDTTEHEWQEPVAWSNSNWMPNRQYQLVISISFFFYSSYFVSFCPLFRIAWLLSMKSLWAPTSRSNMATVTTPGPVSVGINHSSLSSSDMVIHKQSLGTCTWANEIKNKNCKYTHKKQMKGESVCMHVCVS